MFWWVPRKGGHHVAMGGVILVPCGRRPSRCLCCGMVVVEAPSRFFRPANLCDNLVDTLEYTLVVCHQEKEEDK